MADSSENAVRLFLHFVAAPAVCAMVSVYRFKGKAVYTQYRLGTPRQRSMIPPGNFPLASEFPSLNPKSA